MKNICEKINNIDTKLNDIEVLLEMTSRMVLGLDCKSNSEFSKLEGIAILLDSIKTLQGVQRGELDSIFKVISDSNTCHINITEEELFTMIQRMNDMGCPENDAKMIMKFLMERV